MTPLVCHRSPRDAVFGRARRVSVTILPATPPELPQVRKLPRPQLFSRARRVCDALLPSTPPGLPLDPPLYRAPSSLCARKYKKALTNPASPGNLDPFQGKFAERAVRARESRSFPPSFA